MKRLLLPTAATLVAAGCASVQTLVTDGPKATLDVVAKTDSVGTTGRNWTVSAFADATCRADDDGIQVARDLLAKQPPALAPVALPAARPVTLGFSYVESRIAQNRDCSYTLTFVPQEGRRYVADFSVTGQSSACHVALTDTEGTAVETSVPETSCVENFATHTKLPNGRSSQLDWKVTIQ